MTAAPWADAPGAAPPAPRTAVEQVVVVLLVLAVAVMAAVGTSGHLDRAVQASAQAVAAVQDEVHPLEQVHPLDGVTAPGQDADRSADRGEGPAGSAGPEGDGYPVDPDHLAPSAEEPSSFHPTVDTVSAAERTALLRLGATLPHPD